MASLSVISRARRSSSTKSSKGISEAKKAPQLKPSRKQEEKLASSVSDSSGSSSEESSDDEKPVRPKRAMSAKSSREEDRSKSKRAAILGLGESTPKSILKSVSVKSKRKSVRIDTDDESEKHDSKTSEEDGNILQLGPKSHVRFYNERSNRKGILNAIGYARVSTDMQDKEGKSIPGQIMQFENRCKEKGFNLIYICVDSGISGTKRRKHRPGLNYLYKNAKARDVVMVVDMTRLSRDLEYSSRLRRKFTERRIMLDSFDMTYANGTDEDETMKDFMAMMGKTQVKHMGKKISKKMREYSDAGELPTKPSYGWRFNGRDMPRLEVKEEQEGLQFIRNLLKEKPELTIPEIVQILNDPRNGVAPFRRNREAGQPAWYYHAVKSILVREGIRPGKRFLRLSKEDLLDRDERKTTKKKENSALLEEIREIQAEDPDITCHSISKELITRGVKLGSERKIDHRLVQRVLDGAGELTSLCDPDAEADAADFIKKLRTAEPTMRVAEIIRRLTDAGIAPLLRASKWNHYTVNKLMKKYNIQ